MAGRGPAPKDERRRRNAPVRGEAVVAPGEGWQYGEAPIPPEGLMPASVEAWTVWFGSWFAAHWGPEDVPGLRQVIRLYDQVERGEFVRATELRQGMDNYGITPKGQQDRRWKRPVIADEKPAAAKKPSGKYAHLRDVSKGA